MSNGNAFETLYQQLSVRRAIHHFMHSQTPNLIFDILNSAQRKYSPRLPFPVIMPFRKPPNHFRPLTGSWFFL